MIARKGFSFSPSKALASPRSILASYFSSTPQLHPSQQKEASNGVDVSVWWDFKSCYVPEGVNLARVSLAITAALRANGMRGTVQIKGFGKVSMEDRLPYYITLIDVPLVRNEDGAYGCLLASLLSWVCHHPPPAHLFLISNDSRFAATLDRLRMRNYNILVASEAPALLCNSASIMWGWNDLVRGNNLIGKHLNQPPHASWYGDYKLPLEDPFLVAEPSNDESRSVGVFVWWDLDTCPVPEGVNMIGALQAIKAAVREIGINGPVQITAVADILQLSRSTLETLSSAGITVHHAPDGCSNDLFCWHTKIPRPAHLFFITDSDLALIRLHVLRMINYNVLLASNRAVGVLCIAASIMWRWNDLVKGEDLIGKCFNQPPDAAWYGHYKLPLEDPFLGTDGGVDNIVPLLENPYKVIIGSVDLKAYQSINQLVEVVTEVQKYKRLVNLLKVVMDGSGILIFTKTSKGSNQIQRQLTMDGWPALSIHGDEKAERDWAISEFKTGRSFVMIATDYAVRGRDVKDIKYVINYDFPTRLEDYTHRIGRVGAKGTAFAFFTNANAKFARELINMLKEARQTVPPPLYDLARPARSGGGYGNWWDSIRHLWDPSGTGLIVGREGHPR